MTIHVIEGQTSGPEFSELRFQFGLNLLPQALIEIVTDSTGDRAISKFACLSDQTRNFLRLQTAMAANHRNVQADTQSWIPSREFHRLLKSRFIDHQACSSQKA